ncbi:YwiC-like family protein [Streptomyces sp. NBC_00096]|uniref:YwiC-like family protein n=1 Tax=Streptomyces sp. NBC_00096 TaxID=2975650 RepID=UPI00324FF180
MPLNERPGNVPRKNASWIPDQHGAWAMLTVPFLAGTLLSPRPGWAHALLLAAWLLGYAAVFHAQQWLRLRRVAARRPAVARGHVRPAVVIGGASALAGIPLAVLHPWLLLAGAAAAPFVAVNTWYAARNRERALVNGLVAVVPACGMLLVAARLGGGGPPWAPAAACLLYFGGTVPYVKTMIRERNSRTYHRASVAYHAAAVALAALLSPWLAIPFAACLARAAALPGRGVKVPVVGAIELAASAGLLASLLLLF